MGSKYNKTFKKKLQEGFKFPMEILLESFSR